GAGPWVWREAACRRGRGAWMSCRSTRPGGVRQPGGEPVRQPSWVGSCRVPLSHPPSASQEYEGLPVEGCRPARVPGNVPAPPGVYEHMYLTDTVNATR